MAVNQVTKVKLADGTVVPLVDWSHRPIYSTVDLLSGMTDESVRAFNYTRSETVSASGNFPAASLRTATLEHTNVDSKSEMDATEEYLVYAIRVEAFQFVHNAQNNSFDLGEQGLPLPPGNNLMFAHNRLILELEVSEKAFPQAGLGWFVAGFGPHITMSDSAAAFRSYGVNGLPSREAVSDMVNPVHLGGTEDYAIIIHNPGGTLNWIDDLAATDGDAIISLRVYLDGLHKRATG